MMREERIMKQMTRFAVLISLFLIPFTPLIVASSFFFPFITGKAFFFRILVEIAVAAYIVLALSDTEYRPRFSMIGALVGAFVAWMLVADVFALNVTKALWSNFERMEGWVLLAHLLGFFVVASNVLRVEKKWREWFLTSIGVSVILVGYALLQLAGTLAIHQGSTRIDASFGNSAYFAIYLLFTVCIASWLALTERKAWLKWSLLALAGIETILIFFTETRGAVLGLIGAIAVAALLTALTAGQRVRRVAYGALVLLVLISGGFYVMRESPVVQQNHVLQRIASISLADGKTRFTIWHLAFQGFKERPVTGWGQEGFNYVFNKYYEPSLYGQESWFDRAHNAFVDWLMAGGLPAFLLFLSLFVTTIYTLWKFSEISRPEKIALTAALAGYAIHNFFVFDNLYSYIYFFAILALVDSQIGRPTRLNERATVSEEVLVTNVLPATAVALIACIWFVNIRGMATASTLVEAISPSAIGFDKSASLMQDLLSSNSPYRQEIAEQSVSLFMQTLQRNDVPLELKQKFASMALAGMSEQVRRYPNDARERLQLSYAYQNAGLLDKAFEELRAALALSPNKAEFYMQEGILFWAKGDLKAARDAFMKGYEMAGRAPGLAEYAAAGEIAVGNMAAARSIIQTAYSTTTVDSNVLAFAYENTKHWAELIAIWQLRVANNPEDPQQLFSLAGVYYRAGDTYRAMQTLERAALQFPETKDSVAAAIKQIQSGGKR
jgi:O-antigen ligase/Tfp pilus assembly protein PilF